MRAGAVALALIASLAAASFASAASVADVLIPGKIFRDCADVCPELVVIPQGAFIMGSDEKAESPRVSVTIAKPFALGRYETTFDEYDACVDAGGCAKKPFDRDWGRGRRPVHTVTLVEIEGYLAWLSKKSGHRYRLPSEEEWEYAARAGTTTDYWFGNVMIAGEVNCRDCATEWSNIQSAPVGTFKPNPWGLYDVHGNLNEMVADCWNPNHEGAPTDGSIRTTGSDKCVSRVLKGGAWYYNPRASRSAWRARNDARVASYVFGFRVLREID
jgi:formylglycine-generating enzyme required for sulfatase activity